MAGTCLHEAILGFLHEPEGCCQVVILQGTLVIVCDGKGVVRLQGQAPMVTIHHI